MPDVTDDRMSPETGTAELDSGAPPVLGTVLAAQVTGAHGVSGNVRLRLIGANGAVAAEALRNAANIMARRDDDGFVKQLELTSLKKQLQAKGGWIARFKGVTNRPSAEELYGC